MRKVSAIVIAFLMFGVVACSGGGEEADTVTTTTTAQVSTTVTTTTIANLPTHKWEYEDVTILGEIVKVDFGIGFRTVWDAPIPGTALQIVDAQGKYHYLGLHRAMNVFKVGQRIRATYEVRNLYKVYDDGTRELIKTKNYNTKRGGVATKHNSDGSISFEKFDWILMDIENITILASWLP